MEKTTSPVYNIVFKDMLFPEASGHFLVSKSIFRATKCIIITKLLKTYSLYCICSFAEVHVYKMVFEEKRHFSKSMFKAQASKWGVLSFIIYQVFLGVVYTPAVVSKLLCSGVGVEHVWYININILTWLQGFRVKNFKVFVSFVSQFPKETWLQRKQHQV